MNIYRTGQGYQPIKGNMDPNRPPRSRSGVVSSNEDFDLPKNRQEIEKGVICTDHDGRRWKKVNGKRVYLDLYEIKDRIDELLIEDD